MWSVVHHHYSKSVRVKINIWSPILFPTRIRIELGERIDVSLPNRYNVNLRLRLVVQMGERS